MSTRELFLMLTDGSEFYYWCPTCHLEEPATNEYRQKLCCGEPMIWGFRPQKTDIPANADRSGLLFLG